MSRNSDAGFDMDALTRWAESDEPTRSGVTVARCDDAAREGRALVRMAGRPSLGRTAATGNGRSPRRQVRLPYDLNSELDRYVHAESTSASEVIRLAVSEYLDHHRPDLANA